MKSRVSIINKGVDNPSEKHIYFYDTVTPPETLSIKTFAITTTYALAVTDNSEVWMWGSPVGQAFEDAVSDTKTLKKIEITSLLYRKPEKLSFLSRDRVVTKISCNNKMSLFLTENGNVYSQGVDPEGFGLLGMGKIRVLEKPTLIDYFSENSVFIQDIALSNRIASCLNVTSKVYIWGSIKSKKTGLVINVNRPKLLFQKEFRFKRVYASDCELILLQDTGNINFYSCDDMAAQNLHLTSYSSLKNLKFLTLSVNEDGSCFSALSKDGRLYAIFEDSFTMGMPMRSCMQITSHHFHDNQLSAIAKDEKGKYYLEWTFERSKITNQLLPKLISSRTFIIEYQGSNRFSFSYSCSDKIIAISHYLDTSQNMVMNSEREPYRASSTGRNEEIFEIKTPWLLATSSRDTRKTKKSLNPHEKIQKGLFAKLIEDSYSGLYPKGITGSFDDQYINVRDYEKNTEESLLLRPLTKEEMLSTNHFEDTERNSRSYSNDKIRSFDEKTEKKLLKSRKILGVLDEKMLEKNQKQAKHENQGDKYSNEYKKFLFDEKSQSHTTVSSDTSRGLPPRADALRLEDCLKLSQLNKRSFACISDAKTSTDSCSFNVQEEDGSKEKVRASNKKDHPLKRDQKVPRDSKKIQIHNENSWKQINKGTNILAKFFKKIQFCQMLSCFEQIRITDHPKDQLTTILHSRRIIWASFLGIKLDSIVIKRKRSLFSNLLKESKGGALLLKGARSIFENLRKYQERVLRMSLRQLIQVGLTNKGQSLIKKEILGLFLLSQVLYK